MGLGMPRRRERKRGLSASTTSMRLKFAGWMMGAALAVVVAGCQGGGATASKAPVNIDPNNPAAGTGVPEGFEPKTDATGGTGSTPTDPTTPKGDGQQSLNIPAQNFEVKPVNQPNDQWETVAPTEIEKTGTQIDQALANLKDAMADTQTTIEYKGAQLAGKGTLKVRDRRTFSLEWYQPKTEARTHRAIGNGQKRVHSDGGEFEPLAAFGNTKSAPLKLDTLADQMPTIVSSVFAQDQLPWAATLKALEADPAFSTTMETTTARIQDKDRKIVRIVAERKTGSPVTYEFVIDGERWLPVTLRSVAKFADGTESKFMWTARWAFGGAYEDKEFALPSPTKIAN